jgi:DHA1 family purine ribonucleoside efflux pump-like MFS transporter
VFVLAAGAASIALVMQMVSLPRVPATATSGLRALGSTLRSRVVLLGLLATMLVYGGHFAGFTYIRPLTANLSGIDASELAFLLLLFGVTNLAGTLLAGPLADRAPRVGVALFPMTVGGGMVLMLVAGGSTPGLVGATTVWGLGFGGVATSLQTWGARVSPSRLEQIGGLLVMVANAAVAAGAIVGGVILDGSPTTAMPLLGGLASMVGGVLLGRCGRAGETPRNAAPG